MTVRAVPPPLPFWSWLSPYGPLVVLPALIPLLALYAAPANVLDVSSSLARLVNFVASLVPRLHVHAASTKLPQVALLVDTLIVTAATLIASIVLVQTTINYRYLLRRHLAMRPHPFKSYFALLLGLPVGVGMIAMHVMIAGDPSWARGATAARTLFYGFLAFGSSLLAGWGVGGFVLAVRLFLDGFLFSRPVTTTLESGNKT